MVKHIILWQLKDELSAAEKAEIKANIKTGLEGWQADPGPCGGACEHQRPALFQRRPDAGHHLYRCSCLKGYSTHPAHVAVADGKVRPYTKTRVCLDFEV